ncbi:MAG: hypothetical protein HDT19_02805 [Oscillibacter sp.]|nr:hypothetical protein [Oscillibacter sp.]
MDFLKELEDMGVDVSEGLERVMGDKDLYQMMFDMFVSSVEGSPISLDEFNGGDLTGLIAKVHTLKGITGNLSITPLFTSYTKTLTLLRDNQPAKAREAFTQLLPVQEKILACIRQRDT